MASIIFPTRWANTKPPLGSTINWGHPLSRGLVGCWLMNEGGGNIVKNLISNYPATTNVGATWSPTAQGKSLKFNGSSSYVSTPNGGKIVDFVTGDRVSIMMTVKRNATGLWQPILSKSNSADVLKRNIEIVFEPTTGNLGTANGLDFVYTSSELYQIWSSTSTFTDLNKIYTFVFTYTYGNGSSIKFYINGIPATGSWVNNTGNTNPDSSNNGILAFGQMVNNNEWLNGNIVNIMLWKNRALSPSEIQQLYAEPYCFIAPIKRRFYSAPSVATAALTGTITASTTEDDIIAGGKTIILTLTGDTWIAAGAASFDLQRQNIINGITSAQSETFGWNLVPKALQGVAGVVRTSDTVVTITLDAQITYNITATETITATIPATALTGNQAIVATPTFTVAPVTVGAATPYGYLSTNKGYW